MAIIKNGKMKLADGTEIEFHVPSKGGYVRLWTKNGPGPQVCEKLYFRGPTLQAAPENLDDVLREEWEKRVAEWGEEIAEEQLREDVYFYRARI